MRSLPGWLTGLGNTVNGLFVVDRTQRILTWNGTAERLLGHAARDVIGQRCRDVVRARARSGASCCGPNCVVLQSTCAGSPVTDFDACIRTRSGTDVWLTFSVLVLALPDDPLTVHMFHPARRRDRSDGPAGIGAPDGPMADLGTLSLRERAVLDGLARGRSTSEIAGDLAISPLTVRTHVRNMLAKTKARSRVQLVALALRRGRV